MTGHLGVWPRFFGFLRENRLPNPEANHGASAVNVTGWNLASESGEALLGSEVEPDSVTLGFSKTAREPRHKLLHPDLDAFLFPKVRNQNRLWEETLRLKRHAWSSIR